MAICKNIENSKISLRNKNGAFLCRYHRRHSDRPINLIKPKGLCPEAYHQLYPVLFSMISAPYSELRSKPMVMRCPGTKGNVQFELFRGPAKFSARLINIIKHFVSMVYMTEIRKYRIYIKVKSITGSCPYQLKEGDIFEFNLDKGPEICPAAFNNVFPGFISRIYDFSNKNIGVLACPDHKTNILFSINPSLGDNNIVESDPLCCKSVDNLAIYADSIQMPCRLGYKKGQLFKVKDILKKIGLPCYSLFHVIYPYIYTQLKDGKLGFRSKNYSSAIIQCPNSKVKAEVLLKRLNKDQFEISIKNLKDICPLGLTKGKKFTFNMQDIGKICLISFVALHPYTLIYQYITEDTRFSCPGPEGKVIFALRELGQLGQKIAE